MKKTQYVKGFQRRKRGINKESSIPYKKKGFWNGWKQLIGNDILNDTDNAENFKQYVCSKYDISLTTFIRWRTGRIFKNKSLQVAVEKSITDDFAIFGVTENIWDNENN